MNPMGLTCCDHIHMVAVNGACVGCLNFKLRVHIRCGFEGLPLCIWHLPALAELLLESNYLR